MKKDIILEIFGYLKGRNIVSSESEFSEHWLGYSESYMRKLRQMNAEPSTAHQRKLRSSMNVNNGIFYLTTNNIHAIDGGVRNRCFEIHMCAASADQWLPLFNRVLADKGAQIISPLSALPIIEKCGGSIRDIVAAANVTAVKLLKQAAANSNTADQDAA